jgi:mannose-6-phosphate isomerase-like protein (cupin superfamily)
MATRSAALLLALAGSILAGAATGAAAEQKTIVLIGGAKSEGPARHDYPNGVRLLKALLESSPEVRAAPIAVKAWPDGWPDAPDALADASTLVLYFDGENKHPLLDPARRERFEAAMRAGVGLVTLHQASTVPADDRAIDLARWLGAARYGLFDRTEELVRLEPARVHPVARGLTPFTYFDEFYPTLREGGRGHREAVLQGSLHVQYRDSKPVIITEPSRRTIAWSFERESGGRAFGFTGAHFLAALDEPGVRRLLLNAILWTSGIEVPAQGVHVELPDAATVPAAQSAQTLADDGASAGKAQVAIVTRPTENKVVQFPWGHLTWYASRELGNSQTMTVGEAVIRPDQQNPLHYHPNCDEVLHVVRGHILHRLGDRTAEMKAGDTVTIPTGVRHNARNIGTEDAVLAISFSSADRQVVNE